MISWDFIIADHKFWARAKAICAGGDPNNRAAIRSPGRVSRNPNRKTLGGKEDGKRNARSGRNEVDRDKYGKESLK